MILYLLDTCSISDFFGGIGNAGQKLQAISPLQIAISAITVMEVKYGFLLNPAVSRRFSASFESFCAATQIIPFDRAVADVAAAIRSDLKGKGTPIGSFDLLIGATALAHKRVLVTSNTREFVRIKDLVLEDWRTC